MIRRAAIFFLLSLGAVFAQEDPPPNRQPEVRRALPVNPIATPTPLPEVRRAEPASPPAVPFENPAWMERVRPMPTPTTPAPPVGPEPGFQPYRPQGRIQVVPTPTPEPTPRVPVQLQEAPPAAPAQAPVQQPTPVAQDGEIRISPGQATPEDAAKQALERANAIYARKLYDLAVPEYERFLIAYSKAPGRDQALFRLAECHRMLGNEVAARAGYERLLMEFREGEFAGSGAYRLGEILYGDNLYDAAYRQFQTAKANATSEEVKLSATFNMARSLERMKRVDEAAKVYAEVAAVEKNNPYRDFARLSSAELSASAGKKADALALYEKISTDSERPAMRAEAAVKAAALAAELGDTKKAEKLFDKALAMEGIGDWKSAAVIGLMRVAYDAENYKKVVATPESSLAGLPGDSLPEALLLIANAQRQLGNHAAARTAYDKLMREYPKAPASRNAQFHRLVSLYQLNDPNLIKEVDDFLLVSSDSKERAQAVLLKAEALFKAQKFAEAGKIYQSLLGASDLPKNLQREVLFKTGWCFGQTAEYPLAVKAYTDYLKKYPDSPSVVSAMVQRGLALQQLKEYAAAIEDFDTIITKHKDAKERELALQQKALILGQQKDYKAMVTVFKQLLAEYPKSVGAGQANFWIGWADFEEKDYKGAIASLNEARKQDPAQYGERAGLRIVLCLYYLQDRAGLVKELAENKTPNVPVEITRWLGMKSFEEGNYADAEKYLLPLAVDGAPAEIWINLAEAQIKQGKFPAAKTSADRYLSSAREPGSRARGLLARAQIALGLKEFDDASKLVDEALLLQPEGKINADARLLAGEVLFTRGDYDGASRAFMTVAVLYDDKEVTPKALQRAAEAYKKAGNLLESEKALAELQKRYPEFNKTPKAAKSSGR